MHGCLCFLSTYMVSTDTAGGSLAVTEWCWVFSVFLGFSDTIWLGTRRNALFLPGGIAVCACCMVSLLLQRGLCPAGENESLGSLLGIHWHHPYRGIWDISSKFYEGRSLDFIFGLCYPVWKGSEVGPVVVYISCLNWLPLSWFLAKTAIFYWDILCTCCS